MEVVMNKRRVAAILAAIMVLSTGGAAYAVNDSSRESFDLIESVLKPIGVTWLRLWSNSDSVWDSYWGKEQVAETDVDEVENTEDTSEIVPEPIPEPIPEPQPKYGVDFTRVKELYPNRPFVKKVLTDEMEAHLNKVEIETGIPGAVIMAQAIWEVGWELNTPKGGGRDSLNLFNIKLCEGEYVVMIGSRWQCYDSYIDSVDGYVRLITTLPRYAKAYEHIKNGGDIATYYRMLGEAGYYEHSIDDYTRKCVSIIETNQLLA